MTVHENGIHAPSIAMHLIPGKPFYVSEVIKWLKLLPQDAAFLTTVTAQLVNKFCLLRNLNYILEYKRVPHCSPSQKYKDRF